MAATAAHTRLSFTGTLHDNEIFSFSLADASSLSPEAAATAAQGPAQDAFSNDFCTVNAGATLRHVIAETITAAGAVTASYAKPTQATVGKSLGANIDILTMAVTLETATPGGHGRFVRGRFYPPAYPSLVGSRAGNASDVDSYALAWAHFITALNTAGLSICVASTTAGGQLAPVTGVTADDIIDTQRRRKNEVRGTRTAVKAV